MSTQPEPCVMMPGRETRGLARVLRFRPKPSRLLGGSLVMLAGSIMVSVLNFGYNMVVARMLGKELFSQAAAFVTLQLIVSAATLSMQMVCAKFVAKNATDEQKSFAYKSLLRRSWMIGISVGLVMALISRPSSTWLNMSSALPMIVLSVGMAFYIPLGVKRGGLQGIYRFRQLSFNYVLETVVKLVAAIGLLWAGFGLNGAVAAITISVIVAYFFPRVPEQLRKQPVLGIPASFGEGVQAIIFFVGQVIINNVDILMVNHFFKAETAGLYAAFALIGRVLYIASWQVVNAMFPIAAAANPHEEEGWSAIAVPLAMVTGIALCFLAVVGFAPDFVLHVLFGAKFRIAGADNLLLLRTIATAGYVWSVVMMTYEMSRRIANTGWFQLVIAGMVVVGIALFHNTLWQVIALQQVLMGVLFLAVAVPFVRARIVRTRGAA
jgi:O-antigen/teichoic acid export membrane protein